MPERMPEDLELVVWVIEILGDCSWRRHEPGVESRSVRAERELLKTFSLMLDLEPVLRKYMPQ